MAIKNNTEFFAALKQFIVDANGNYMVGQLEQNMTPIKDYLIKKIEKIYKNKERQYDFLTKFDSAIQEGGDTPPNKFYGTFSCEFIQPLYKLLNYSAISTSNWNKKICYTDEAQIKALQSSSIDVKMSAIVDSIMYQILQYAPAKLLYVGISEILIEEKYTIQKLCRMLYLMSQALDKFQGKRSKFMSTILYLIGGRMKIEVINYLRSKDTTKLKSEYLNAYVSQKEKTLLRDLTKEEIDCFESDMINELLGFITTLRTKENKGIFSHSVEEMASNIMREDFIDDYDDIVKKTPQDILPIEESHYVILFCSDVLSFIHLMFGDISLCKDKLLEFNERKQILATPVSLILPENNGYKLNGSFSQKLIEALCNTIIHVSNSPFAVYNSWYNIKRKNFVVEKKDDSGYQRTQLYDDIGISMFFYYLLNASTQNYYKLNLNYSIGPYTTQHLLHIFSIFISSLLSKEETYIHGLSILSLFITRIDKYTGELLNNEFLKNDIRIMLTFIGSHFNEEIRLRTATLLKSHLSHYPIEALHKTLLKLIPLLNPGEINWIFEYLLEELQKPGEKDISTLVPFLLEIVKLSQPIAELLECYTIATNMLKYIAIKEKLTNKFGFTSQIKATVETEILAPICTKLANGLKENKDPIITNKALIIEKNITEIREKLK